MLVRLASTLETGGNLVNVAARGQGAALRRVSRRIDVDADIEQEAPNARETQRRGIKERRLAGRPPGSRNKATMLAEQLLDGEAESLVRQAIEIP